VAEFIGRMNVLQLSPGPDGPGLCGQPLSRDGGALGDAALIGIRPEDVILGGPEPGIRVEGVVEKAVFLGNVTRVTLGLAGQKLLVEMSSGAPRFERGARVEVCLPSEAIRVLHEG
jgi:ABC-type Fe3+/spermidine/putrescine transport system ATPase subunit